METKLSLIKNNLKEPLKLKWDKETNQYKVNKPLDQSGEYVDKSMVDELLEALKKCACLDGQYRDAVDRSDIARQAIYKITE